MSKTYDSTFARIAGNIAAGLVSRPNNELFQSGVANQACEIAERIIERAEEREAKKLKFANGMIENPPLKTLTGLPDLYDRGK